MDIQAEKLTGARVELIAMEPVHAAPLFEAARFPEIWTYIHTTSQLLTVADMDLLVAEAIRQRDLGLEWPFVVFDKESGRIVGSTRYLDISHQNRGVEIGWTWLTPAVWRTQVNTECKYLLLQHAFEAAQAIRVQLKTDSRNLRSQAAIARIGAVKEGVLRRHRIMSDGYKRDSVYYSIIAEEWPDVKLHLSKILAAG